MSINQTGQSMGKESQAIDFHEYLKKKLGINRQKKFKNIH